MILGISRPDQQQVIIIENNDLLFDENCEMDNSKSEVEQKLVIISVSSNGPDRGRSSVQNNDRGTDSLRRKLSGFSASRVTPVYLIIPR
jgi:hypothetical protein